MALPGRRDHAEPIEAAVITDPELTERTGLLLVELRALSARLSRAAAELGEDATDRPPSAVPRRRSTDRQD